MSDCEEGVCACCSELYALCRRKSRPNTVCVPISYGPNSPLSSAETLITARLEHQSRDARDRRQTLTLNGVTYSMEYAIEALENYRTLRQDTIEECAAAIRGLK